MNFCRIRYLNKGGTLVVVKKRPIVFLAGGQGAQFTGMGISQFENDPIFRETMNSLLSGPILSPIKQAWLNGSEEIINKSSFTQPLLIALGVASSRSLTARGVRPDALLGHSAGEFALAIFAGLMSDEETHYVLENRYEILKYGSSGSMQAVRSNSRVIESLIRNNELSAWIAADNSPAQCLVSAECEILAKFVEIANENSILSLPATSDMPFHSPLVKEKALEIEEILTKVQLSELQVPMISGSTGSWISYAECLQPKFWSDQIWKRVKFWSALDVLLQQEWTIVDLGPGTGISAIVSGHPSVRSGKSEVISLMPARRQDQFADWLQKVKYIEKICS